MTTYLTAEGASITTPERELIKASAEETARRFGPGCAMVNIGVGRGGATCYCLRAGAPDAHLVGVDYDLYAKAGDWRLWLADSRKAHREWTSPIHLLLIDGDHHYQNVVHDITGWAPKVVAGGLVLFHDYGNGHMVHLAGVARAVNDTMSDEQWEAVGGADSIRAYRRRQAE